MTYTINAENNIVAGAVADVENGQQFSTLKELAKLANDWPASRFVAIWNSFAGVTPFDDLRPVKNFPTREIAVNRIWAAITRLARDSKPGSKAPRTAKELAKLSKKKSAKKGPSAAGPKSGQIYEREYKGKKYVLRSIEKDGEVVFKLRGGETYNSLTGAAKGVTEYPSISGPAFWGEGARDAGAGE